MSTFEIHDCPNPSQPLGLGSSEGLGPAVPERAALAACPFCGERPRLTLRPDDAEAMTYFAAVACYCGGYSACAHKMATAPTADEAETKVRAAWNCRA
jgi:Lar family restriction alleviation protein